jgi:hypothetical protein
MKMLTRLTVASVAGVALLGWTTNASAQVTPLRPPHGPPTHHIVRVIMDTDTTATLYPDTLVAHPQDWVIWVWEFPTTHAEVYLCKDFHPADPDDPSGPGQTPGGACLEQTDEAPAVLKTKVRVGALFGRYEYSVAFVTLDGRIGVIDPELIVRPRD